MGEPVVADVDKLTSNVKSDPLWDLLGEKKTYVGVPSIKTVTIYDPTTEKERFLTQDEYYKFVKVRGEYLKSFLTDNYEELKGLSPEEFKSTFTEAKKQATEMSKQNLISFE